MVLRGGTACASERTGCARTFVLGVAAASLTLCGCAIDRMHLSAPLSPSESAPVNARLLARPAVVTWRNDKGEVERENVGAAQFDDEGTLAVARVVRSDGRSPGSEPTYEWTRIPGSDVVEITTVDHERGAIKGLLYGGLGGFLPAFVSGTFVGAQWCQGLGHCSSSAGTALALGALVGVVVGLGTGGIGAAIGAITGDGTVVDVTSESTASSGALR